MLVMESVGLGARSLGAVTVSFCGARGGSVARKQDVLRYGLCRRTLRAAAATAAEREAVKEGFADEEDYVKAGGSELVFVQMQRNKDMDQQSKLADKVWSLSELCDSFDCLSVRYFFFGDFGCVCLDLQKRSF